LALNLSSCLATPLVLGTSIAIFRWLGLEAGWFGAGSPAMFARVVLLIVLPVCIGIWLARRFQEWSKRYAPAFARASGLGILVVLTATVIHRWDGIIAMGMEAASASVQFLLLSTLLAFAAAFLLRLSREHAPAFVLCAPTRNLGVATAILIAIPGGMESIAVLAIYFLLEFPMMPGVAAIFRRRVFGVGLFREAR
ncbi:MAG: bile acid:sodium symporter, partial [Verrucomicrobiales bacterium]